MAGLHKFSLKKFSLTLVIASFSFAITWNGKVSGTPTARIYSILTYSQDTTKPNRTDTANRNRVGTNSVDTAKPVTKVDTFSLKLSKDTLDGPVNYEAEDSVVVLVQHKKILLYGKTKTTYEDITLTAPEVELNQETNILTAIADRDSTGEIATRAHFEQGANKFESDTIKFNFKTQKGLTRNTYTQQDEMYVQGEKIKKIDQNTFFVHRGRFTTCNLDHPHFAFRTNKLKIINNKIAVSGPTHPEFEDVPVPIYLPFGFFPMNKGRHSGMLPPQFTTNESFGLGLEGLGYYKVLSDNIDLTLRGNVYSYGGYSANLTSTYRTRYRFNGGFNLSYQRTKTSFKGDQDYSLFKTYAISWNHSVDQRARPGTNFSANVNAGSTRFNRLVPNDPMRNFTNQLSSSIAYSKSWAGKPYNLTLSANHNQNNRTHVMNLSLPDGSFAVQTLYPFQRKEVVGSPKWYEKLGIGYTGNFRNQVSFYDTARTTIQSLLDTLQWGAQHSIPITLSLPPVGPLMVSPSISYSEVWLQHRMRRAWNPVTEKIDTVYQEKGLYTARQMSFGFGLSTSLFGTYQFRNARMSALRHIVRPSLSFSYVPDLSKGYTYDVQVNKEGQMQLESEFAGRNLYSVGAQRRSGTIGFNLDNNLEMKWRSRKDTGENAIKKIRLIDGFGLNTGYNIFADSLNLSPVSLYLRSTLFEKLNLNMQANLSPYKFNQFGYNINKFAWSDGFNLGHITYGSVSLSTSFQSKTRDGKDPKTDPNRIPVTTDPTLMTDPNYMADQQNLVDYMRRNPAEFVDFNVPWSINLSFSLNFSRRPNPDGYGFETDLNSNVNFSNSFSLTPKWNFSTNGYLDVETRKLQAFSMSISRDMHCWQMSIGVTPVGLYPSFNITINPKASILQDLRVNRSRYFTRY